MLGAVAGGAGVREADAGEAQAGDQLADDQDDEERGAQGDEGVGASHWGGRPRGRAGWTSCSGSGMHLYVEGTPRWFAACKLPRLVSRDAGTSVGDALRYRKVDSARGIGRGRAVTPVAAPRPSLSASGGRRSRMTLPRAR